MIMCSYFVRRIGPHQNQKNILSAVCDHFPSFFLKYTHNQALKVRLLPCHRELRTCSVCRRFRPVDKLPEFHVFG